MIHTASYDTTDFVKKCSDLGISLSDKQIEQFLNYYELLVEWNSFMNLTAITDFDEVILKHFVDSISLCKYISFQHGDTLIDIGTGAGFPGIPIKILCPDCKITLLDSLNKRINFLNTVIEQLHLTDIITIHGRAEDIAKTKEHRENYNYAISRAVANLSTLSELCIPFVKQNGYFISYKSEKGNEELLEAKNAIEILGGSVDKQISYQLPDSDLSRNLILIRKRNITPKKYPRKAGTPSKEPL